jgi:uncharacterized membrane protein
MNKTRLEAFSDGVIAIIITIMVLELKAPHETGLRDLVTVLPVCLGYLLSFVYVGIYWVNHHQLLQSVRRIDGRTLWANLHLLFWMSLIPFATAWVAERRLEFAPVALYGAVLFMCSISFALLATALAAAEGDDARAGKKHKNLLSIALYALALPLSAWNPAAGTVVYVVVALMWFSPAHARRRAGQTRLTHKGSGQV